MATPVPVDIKTHGVIDTSFTATDASCKICLKSESKYTCPRCNIAYCSVSCYQDEKHTGCSEAFYKDCVITELQDKNASEEDKKKVMDILSRDLEDRTEEDDLQNEEEPESLSDRLQGLDLDKDISAVWGQLSSKEKEEFAHMLQDGRLARLIEIWTPWWRCKPNMKLVKEHGEQSDVDRGSSSMPQIITDAPDINDLLKISRPSSGCRFDLINILFAYPFVCRIHNGDHQDCPVDSSQLLLDTSVVLGKQTQHGSIGEAIQQGMDAIQTHSKEKQEEFSLQFSLTVLEDVNLLISGPGTNTHGLGFMTAALSDIILLLRKSLGIIKKELKGEKKGNDSLQQRKSQTFKAEKKAVFFLSWLQRYGMGTHQLLPLLQLELERRQSDMEEVEELKCSVERHLEHLQPKTEEKKIVEL